MIRQNIQTKDKLKFLKEAVIFKQNQTIIPHLKIIK